MRRRWWDTEPQRRNPPNHFPLQGVAVKFKAIRTNFDDRKALLWPSVASAVNSMLGTAENAETRRTLNSTVIPAREKRLGSCMQYNAT